MTTDNTIQHLIAYGIHRGLISPEDRVYSTNRLLELLHRSDYSPDAASEDVSANLKELLASLTDYAYENGLIPENSVVYRDLFDTALMGCLTPPPSAVIAKFRALYAQSPKVATDFYYTFSQDTNYIRRDRIQKDLKWVCPTDYGDLDITVNLSKPEKDPKAIAAARNAAPSGYPKCQLCAENEGYAGRPDHPARQNHRVIPLTVNGTDWCFQYSPYVYYNEHCIVFNRQHIPMKIERATFAKLLDFVRQFPHYFVGSNADLPIVGGSILSHDHFQGGRYDFAMAKAPVETAFTVKGFTDVQTGIVKWPMSVIRARCEEPRRLIDFADKTLQLWRSYTDPSAFIFAKTNGEPHNTITPIARKNGAYYELDLVLRNNITTDEHPLGVFHPHAPLHHIKKENIGLIEVMGLAVLPSRLKSELHMLAEYILTGRDLRSNEQLDKHADWVEAFLPQYSEINKENIMDILQREVGLVFLQVLSDAGIFKRDQAGHVAFERFIAALSE